MGVNKIKERSKITKFIKEIQKICKEQYDLLTIGKATFTILTHTGYYPKIEQVTLHEANEINDFIIKYKNDDEMVLYKLLHLTNRIRVRNDLKPLTLEESLHGKETWMSV